MANLSPAWVRCPNRAPKDVAKLPYAAYGSNLRLEQMAARCPEAQLIGAGTLPRSRLEFARVATIRPSTKHDTPVGLYRLTPADVAKMDRYEGNGHAYDRYVLPCVAEDGSELRVFTYVRNDDTPEAPRADYVQRVMAGYADWQFDSQEVKRAVMRVAKRVERRRAVERASDRYLRKSSTSKPVQWKLPVRTTSTSVPRSRQEADKLQDGRRFTSDNGYEYFRNGNEVWTKKDGVWRMHRVRPT